MFRVLRLLLFVQMSKVVRHHMAFRELRLMCFALRGAVKSLLWSSVMLLMVILSFAVVFTEGTLSFCVWNAAMEAKDTVELRLVFGTLWDSILSLGKSMSGGADWGDIYNSLEPLDWRYKFLFLWFQSFSFIALVNVVTAVFVESTMERSRKDRESVVTDRIQERNQFLDNMRMLFQEFDRGNKGEVSLADLKRHMRQPKVSMYFASLGVAVDQISRLFTLLDRDSSGLVDEEEFVFGCWHLKG